MEKLSGVYAKFITTLAYEDVTPEVREHVKKLILDYVGVTLAGYHLMEFPKTVVRYVSDLGGLPEATIFHVGTKVPAIHAAFANAACGHALDLDDGHRFAALHPGTVTIPAAFAAAEMTGAPMRRLVSGILIGYELMIRISMAINPSSLNRGFHPTGMVGQFGAAAAAAHIMGLGYEETVGALGLAGLSLPGLMQCNHEEGAAHSKPITPARAAQEGLLSCVLAQRGVRGPEAIFEGVDGYLKAVTDKVTPDVLTADLGRDFKTMGCYIKLYSACRHAHAPVDAAVGAFKRAGIDVNDISEIVVETYPVALRLAGIAHPGSSSAGRFSIPFSIALALIKGEAGATQYSIENISDPKIQELTGKVRLVASPHWEELYPKQRGATVTIVDHQGRRWNFSAPLAKGEPENPVEWDELYGKFLRNATLLISEARARDLADAIMMIEKKTSLNRIFALT
ncbi:MAG: MmgE/PrpD family protein [Deltaproteobacteria bacterium]|nr:MmgE/PrpD family protein [Deltaproteobacteria bacterium]